MEVHDTTIAGVTATATASATAGAAMRRTFLIINCIILSIGNCGGPLIMRLYYVRGGKRIWFSSWLQTGGLPIILLPLLYSYTHRRNTTTNPNFFLMKPRVCIAAAVIGILIGLDNYLYAYGVAKLPISTSTLIVATQLVFTATFSYLLVKQKFTAYSINAVVLLTLGAVVLGVHASGDRPEGVSNKEYWLGFFLTVAAAALYGFILPMVELMYKKAKQEVKYTVVMEVQLVMCFIATAFCTVGMIINNDFQAISREAKEYEIGATKYYMVVVSAAIIWQCYFLGAIGVIFYSSSFLSGVIVTVLLSITEVLAVILFSEKFHAEKGISLFLSLWGFVSYFFGEIKHNRKNNKENLNEDQTSEVQTSEVQLAHQDSIP